METQRNIRSSDLILAYSFISLLTTAVYIRTLHDTGRTSTGDSVTVCAYLALLFFGFVAEAWPPGSATSQPIEGGHPFTAYDTANSFSRIIFHYMQPVISKGYRQPLTQSDLDNIMPSRILTATSYSRVSEIWLSHVAQNPTNPSMLKAIVMWGGLAWIPVTVAALSHVIFSYCTPILLGELVSFVGSYAVDGSKAQPVTLGLILAFALFFSSLFSTMADGQQFQLSANLGAEVRTGLISMIYRKALVLSTCARQTMTVGEISNRMAVDCERIATALQRVPFVVVLPIELGIGIWLLYVKLGWCSLAGLGVIVLISPAQTVLAQIISKGRNQKLAAMDARIRLTNEILSGIKIIKLYGWEESLRKRIETIRERELTAIRKVGTSLGFTMIMFTSLHSLMTLVSLAVYAVAGGPGFTRGEITAEKIFVTVSLFEKLSLPIGRLSMIISQMINLSVALKRIRDYLLAEEIDDAAVIRRMKHNVHVHDTEMDRSFGENTSIVVKDGHFAWVPEPEVVTQANKEKRSKKMKDEGQNENGGSSTPVSADPTLIDINLRVPQ
ncbi:hypothetical protein BGW41_005710, partial [Actinomortierella wolfii]